MGRGRGTGRCKAGPADWLSNATAHRVGVQQSARAGRGDQFVITESTHMCGYPGCGKRFRFKHDLLRHQTKVHGREPKRRVRGSATTHAYDDYGGMVAGEYYTEADETN